MLSKELVQNVLNIVAITEIETLNNELYYSSYKNPNLGMKWKTINVYELSHLCKEWATSKDYEICTQSYKNLGYRVSVYRNSKGVKHFKYEILPTEHLQEPEAVFKACEWILKKIKG